MDIEEPVEIENEMNITKAIEILNKLKSKVSLIKADEKEYRLPFLMDIEQQAIETVLSELEKKYKVINEIVRIDPHIYRVANIRLEERERRR